VTFLLVTLTISGVCLLASWVPAVQASRVNPITVLHDCHNFKRCCGASRSAVMSCAIGSRPAWNTRDDPVAANEGENTGPGCANAKGAGAGGMGSLASVSIVDRLRERVFVVTVAFGIADVRGGGGAGSPHRPRRSLGW
jgi:hypothetical protein